MSPYVCSDDCHVTATQLPDLHCSVNMNATKEEMKTSYGAAAAAGEAPDGSAGETLFKY